MTAISALIVDDDLVDRYVTRRRLTKNVNIGAVAEARDGAEALAMLEDGRFEADLGPHPPRTLVLLDLNMPGMSGFDLLERIQSHGPIAAAQHCVIAVLSSSAHPGDKQRALASPFVDAYVEKPLTTEQLQALLEQFWSLDPRPGE